ncbi:flagellar brake protein [Lederbergia lenta]|uniref:flagellar brake protein n=1 Tax=Lederbergia lenta TaxID=1467 RepID=UPI00203DDA9D|nr:flagellar brake domain-containing protein [Lederbergia lenta]MCM3111631.1 flagellar brake domain-containing protein [Lederbergia lenta]
MIKVGMEVILEIHSETEIEKYKSKIADYTNEKVFIQYPVSLITKKTSFLANGMTISVNFVDEQSDAYSFESYVTGRVKDPIPMIALHLPEEKKIQRIQRREFVRIETSVDIACDFPISESKFTTISDDFSAGGCAIVIPKHIHLQNGEVGMTTVVLPMQNKEYHYLELECRVTRIHEKENITLASLQFLNSDKYEQQLIRFSFEKQLERRKKEIEI